MNKRMGLSIVLIVLILGTAMMADHLVPNDPYDNKLSLRLQEASLDYPLGTDNMGRCNLSRLLVASRTTLSIALQVSLVSMVLGVGVGALSGYYGGLMDRLLQLLLELFLAFPPFVYVLVFIGLVGNSTKVLILSMAMATWAQSAKAVRAKVIVEKDKLYVQCARLCGSSDGLILIKHILPNVMTAMFVFFSLQFGDVILLISGFSFLGLGISSDIPEWGNMVSSARETLFTRPSQMFYPVLCIFIVVMAFNNLAEGIREKYECT